MDPVKRPTRPSAMSIVFLLFVASAIIFAAFTGRMKEITTASFEAAKSAVTLAIGLIGIMALWLGMVRILEAGGFMYTLARLLKPIMTRLFPDVPPTHPAMSAMILNISANLLGLGNAATPFGIKAMIELNKLNPLPGTATNAMCLFLAINTSHLSLLPLGMIGVRAAAGSSRPADIFMPTLLATACGTIVAICAATLLARRDRGYRQECLTAESAADSKERKVEETQTAQPADFSHLLLEPAPYQRILGLALPVLLAAGAIYSAAISGSSLRFFAGDFITYWFVPVVMLLMVSYGLSRGVKVYEAVTEGAKQGFEIAVRIIPYLVSILVAVEMFRASGAMEQLGNLLSPITGLIGMPADTLPVALVRPLSGSGAFALVGAIVKAAPDSYSAFVASTMMGSTETTFYVLAVYFGAVGVARIRHALAAGLLADITGLVAACLFCRFWWG